MVYLAASVGGKFAEPAAPKPKEEPKPAELTPEEWAIIKKHPEIGYKYLKRIQGMGVLESQAIYQHHERFNGGGYPRGLSKENITEYGYILGIADVYDAVTNNRDYKRRMLPDKAREVLMGTVDNFFPLKIVEDKAIILLQDRIHMARLINEVWTISAADEWFLDLCDII